jgi:succinate dehydrogenase/fumarate reductase cytochrome b subunit
MSILQSSTLHSPKERTMNTTHRLTAVAFSFVLTLGMLVGIDGLATSKAHAPQMAQAPVAAQA